MFSDQNTAEVHLTSPKYRPGGYAIHHVVEACLRYSDEQARNSHSDYENRGWSTVMSFVPSSLNTREGILRASSRGSSLLNRGVEYYGRDNNLHLAWADSPELVIGAYCLQDPQFTDNIWRGVALWKVPGLINAQE